LERFERLWLSRIGREESHFTKYAVELTFRGIGFRLTIHELFEDFFGARILLGRDKSVAKLRESVRKAEGISLASPHARRLEPREWLVDTFAAPVIPSAFRTLSRQLGDALVAAKQYPRAKEIFEQLVDRQPESDPAKRKLNGVLRKMGLLAPDPTEPEPFETLQAELAKPDGPKVRHDIGSSLIDTDSRAAGSAPISAFMEDSPDDETQKFIAQSLTDVDLFASYGLTQKAIGLLEAILRRAPRHTQH